jgi:HK97 family phage prohead protease
MAPNNRLRSPLRIKAGDIAEDGSFAGYGSVFNVVDSGGDIIVSGAFAASLQRHAQAGTRPKMLWQHCHDQPIGSWLEMREDDHGLWCRGKLLTDVQQAREAYVLMKAGELDGLSIGYETLEWEPARADEMAAKYGYGGEVGYGMPAGQVRVLKQVELWEVSPVTFPMNEAARVETVKRRQDAAHPDMTPILAALERRGLAFA